MKKTLSFIALLALTILLSACATDNSTNENTPNKEMPTLSIGVLPATDNLPFMLAHEKGFDVKHGVNLDIQVFKAAKDREAAFQAGALQGLATDLIGVAISRQSGSDLMITSNTFGQFDLLTGDDSVRSIADLKGKDVIVSKNTGAEYAMAKMLENVGLTMEDINVIEVAAIPARLELLKNGQASAAILPEPFATIAKVEGLRLLESTMNIGINPFVMAFPKEVIQQNSDAIRAMYMAYNEAVAYIQTHNKEDYLQLFIDVVGFPQDLKKQIQIPDYLPAEQVKEEDIVQAFSWARSVGLLKMNLTPQDVISTVNFK